METLLSLKDEDAFVLMQIGHKYGNYGHSFYKITQESREMKMIERVKEYMKKHDRRRDVIIFTDIRHL